VRPRPQERGPGARGQGPGEAPLRKPPVQRIFEAQGYVVVACAVPGQAVGDVIPCASGGEGYEDFNGPMVIIAPATEAEWRAQQKLHSAIYVPPHLRQPWAEYWKVVAE
jgi:hypothetical protein